jgi:formate-dependent nitrite reductase cytochrome c552 subunit
VSRISTTTWALVAATGAAVVAGAAFVQKAKPLASISSAASLAASATPLHPVTIQRPAGPPRVNTSTTNFHGQAVTVACGTCHTTTQPNARTRTSAALVQFHQGLKYAHGELTCLSCHNPSDYDTLRLADGRSVDFTDVMTLCGQCHGPQLRDYQHGAHGGMTGYWDLSRGPRTRNNCVNCHDPHSPKYPLARPVFPPRDRISVPVKASAANH